MAFANIDIDGDQHFSDDFYSLNVEFSDEELNHRCVECNSDLYEDGNDEYGETECSYSDTNEHVSEAKPLSWVNHAGVTADDDNDSVTVHISVGDPRGAFTMRIERMDDGSLRMSLPTPANNNGWQHGRLTEVHPGTYLIG